MLYLRLVRQNLPLNSQTFGNLFLVSEAREERLCYTLEPSLESPQLIPIGEYGICVTLSPRFNRRLPLLLDVPGHSGIRIHAGNTVHDTLGCILVGVFHDFSSLSYSRPVERLITDLCLQFKINKIVIENEY